MKQEITLDDITPQKNINQTIHLAGMIVLTLIILSVTWVWCDIHPFKLYQKKGNAFEYLFGRILSDDDKAQALDRAKRFPKIIAHEEAMIEIKTKMDRQGRRMDSTQLNKLAENQAQEQIDAMPTEKIDAIVKEEYERILDEKKGGFFPPETHPNQLKAYTLALIETIAIAIWGSIFAVILAVPVSLFAATNTLKILFQGESFFHKSLHWFSYFFVRRFLDFCRGFNEFVMALIFVAVIGLGPFAGVLALAIHTFGILGKVFSEAIEAIEPGQVEAVVASGAQPIQVVTFSVFPQVMPLFVSYSLLRFESNVRSATILGFVGAGGIGFLMFDKLNGYLYREVATMMIMVVASVSIIDFFCGKLRNRFI
ncbi:phosphonate ABC transporter, permease protein PhnE [bacterium]|nr:phosphonate ABC transporter, permease protein PhnE [bacterium]